MWKLWYGFLFAFHSNYGRIFIKEWPDLEIWVWHRSRSFKMAQFDRPYTTFYWSAIVTIALSCTIFELFDANQKLGCGFLFAFYSNYGRICSCLWAIQRQTKHVTLETGLGIVQSIANSAVLLVGHCKYSSILYHFQVFWRQIISWPWNRG